MRDLKLAYDMKREALKNITENDTVKAYKSHINNFADFAKKKGLNTRQDVEFFDKKKLVQEYERNLEKKYTSPSTIHSHLAPICKGLNVKMSDIDAPKRTASHITRGRLEEKNKQGKAELNSEKYARLVNFQRAVGIRRDELAHLKSNQIKRDESGHICVEVNSGKGGKYQLQRVLNEDVVINTYKDVEFGSRLFSSSEMSNKINLHGIRAEVAQEAYANYVTKLNEDPAYREVLKKELIARFENLHKPSNGAFQRFLNTLNNDSPYLLRGENKERALALGKDVSYNRLALLAVSVFHLSHWRVDVSVVNYII